MRIVLAIGATLLFACSDSAKGSDAAAIQVLVPRTGIDATELGVLVNDDDSLSVAVAAYYVTARNIPAANVVHLHVGIATPTITEAAFTPLAAEVDAALGADVQALAITWTQPYAVENMSITSAFSLGFHAIVDTDTCNDPYAKWGTPNPYTTNAANTASTHPYTDLGFRPAMMIPATTIAEAEALIDKGVASDDTWPVGTAYLMDTSDPIRSVRCASADGGTNECQTFLDTWDPALSGVAASIVMADRIANKTDVLFYVQGLVSVTGVVTNTYLPGAVADHLTSFGGQVPTSSESQMSAFEWLKAGVTGSFGTVVEPCNFTPKFPDPSMMIPQYFGGATLIEAYWKSVKWPAEGLFIGEPLARPYGTGVHWHVDAGTLTIETTTMVPGAAYVIDAADVPTGPFDVVLSNLTVAKYQKATFSIPAAARAVYRFRAAP